jgi:hypothetical protein
MIFYVIGPKGDLSGKIMESCQKNGYEHLPIFSESGLCILARIGSKGKIWDEDGNILMTDDDESSLQVYCNGAHSYFEVISVAMTLTVSVSDFFAEKTESSATMFFVALQNESGLQQDSVWSKEEIEEVVFFINDELLEQSLERNKVKRNN